jgi:hypothetical protein
MTITRNRDVPFEEDVIDRLARIETALESLGNRAADHEGRVRQLERRQWILAGVAATAAPVLARLGLHIPTIL